jgi:hypothetical protein
VVVVVEVEMSSFGSGAYFSKSQYVVPSCAVRGPVEVEVVVVVQRFDWASPALSSTMSSAWLQ